MFSFLIVVHIYIIIYAHNIMFIVPHSSGSADKAQNNVCRLSREELRQGKFGVHIYFGAVEKKTTPTEINVLPLICS